MTAIEVKEEVLRSWDFAIENDMQDPVIRLYISGESDIDIWNKDGYFYFSTGSWKYSELDELLNDLCKEIEDNRYDVTTVEIE